MENVAVIEKEEESEELIEEAMAVCPVDCIHWEEWTERINDEVANGGIFK